MLDLLSFDARGADSLSGKSTVDFKPCQNPVAAPATDAPHSGRDLLTQVLLGLRLDAVEYSRAIMRSPWAIALDAQRAMHFHFVGQGGAWLRVAGSSDWVQLQPGDAVLLPHGSAHVLASAPEVPPVHVQSLARVTVSENLFVLERPESAAEPAADIAASTVMFCGTLRFNLDPLHPLLAMMPPVMLAGDLARRDTTVPALLDAMEREVSQDRMGACGIMARLADALAASIIRAWVECSCNAPTGWIAAVRCPTIGKVIAAIHNEPERNWSVPELAAIMGASRSRFSDAFTRTMGESPARYVAKVKMSQARRWISHEGMRVAVAAHRLGYESEASFSRAFKRVIGHAPSFARGEGG